MLVPMPKLDTSTKAIMAQRSSGLPKMPNSSSQGHNGLRRAFFCADTIKASKLEHHRAEHANRQHHAVHPSPPLHNGENRTLVGAVIGACPPRVGSSVEAAVQVAGPCRNVVVGSIDRSAS